MSYGETLSRGDTTAFVTALALVADAVRRERARNHTMKEIQAKVCEHFGLSRAELVSGSMERRIARPRQVVMYLSYRPYRRSFETIAKSVGLADHTTAMHAVRQIEHLRSVDPDFAETMVELETALATPHNLMGREKDDMTGGNKPERFSTTSLPPKAGDLTQAGA